MFYFFGDNVFVVAAKFVEDIVNSDGSEEAKVEGRKISQSALRGSFNVLMSMDLQSVENLVELASSSNLVSLLTESKSSAQMETFIQSLSSGNLLKSGNDSHAALGGLLQSLSRGNLLKSGEDSHVALGNLLQSIQTDLHELHDENSISHNLFDPGMCTCVKTAFFFLATITDNDMFCQRKIHRSC